MLSKCVLAWPVRVQLKTFCTLFLKIQLIKNSKTWLTLFITLWWSINYWWWRENNLHNPIPNVLIVQSNENAWVFWTITRNGRAVNDTVLVPFVNKRGRIETDKGTTCVEIIFKYLGPLHRSWFSAAVCFHPLIYFKLRKKWLLLQAE